METEETAPIESDAAAAEASEADLVALGDNDAIFEALWKRTLETWDDDKPHRAILEHALRAEKLPDLAGRYRALKDDPDKGERALKKIDGIVAAATQMLMTMKTPARTKTPWQWTASAALMFAIVCSWLFYELFLRHRH